MSFNPQEQKTLNLFIFMIFLLFISIAAGISIYNINETQRVKSMCGTDGFGIEKSAETQWGKTFYFWDCAPLPR